METRATRKSLSAFPIDFEFTQNPKDDLRKLIDVRERQLQIAKEYTESQLDNVFLGTSDVNEPSYAYESGITETLSTIITGNVVEDIQDLATMEVTGFDLEETITPVGLSGGRLLGVSFGMEPDTSGVVYVTTSGVPYIYEYLWNDFESISNSGLVGVMNQNYFDSGFDEYLSIQHTTDYLYSAELKNTPRGNVTLIDSKNPIAPWNPSESDGITVDSGDITLSGSVVWLTNPRPSYNPATESYGETVYPANYQPDEHWKSSFIAEYQYATHENPYGLTQEEIRHWVGLKGRPLFGAEEL